MNLLAQIVQRHWGDVGTWGIGEFCIALLIAGGIIAVAYIIIKKLNLPIPDWFWQILGIIVLILVGVFAIRLLMWM